MGRQGPGGAAAPDPVRILVLGPVAVRAGERVVAPSAPLVAGLLGALALAGDRGLPAPAVADALWPRDGEDRHRSAVSVVVHRARRWLRDVAGDGPEIVFGPTGYALVGVDVDAARFERLTAASGPGAAGPGAAGGGAAGGEAEASAGVLAEALGLWRGEPLAGAPRGAAQELAVRALTRARLGVAVRYGRLLVELGRAGEAVDVLVPFADRYPLDEPVQAALMEALAGAGRQAEALAAHERLRHRLAEELGIDPGPEVQAALTRVLRQEVPSRVADPGTPVPAQLPTDLRTFVGRERQLRALDELVDGTAPGPVVISALDGSAGIGKTALAVHWAHRRRDRFPDGQLYANLHGLGTLPPVPPDVVLDQFLRALGVAPERVPADLAARSALFRSRVADRRVLVVLDNARDVAQVRPLLPGGSRALALVTSRNQLRGLAVRDGALAVTVDQLGAAEAVALLERYAGAGRVAAEPEAAGQLVELCARLPLALAIVADRAAREPNRRLADLAAELAAARDRLGALAAGDDEDSDVRAVFSWSYRALLPAAARMFRLVGLYPGADLGVPAAAALAGVAPAVAGRLLDTLAAGHLVEQRRPGRYEPHDLLRAYAAELAGTLDPEPVRRAALDRLLGFLTRGAAEAMDLVIPEEKDRRPVPSGTAARLDLRKPDEAADWLEVERGNLVAAAGYAAGHGWPAHAIQLSGIMHRYLRDRARWEDALALHGYALTAARATGDGVAEAYALNCLSTVYRRTGRSAEAERYAEESLAAARRAGDATHEGQALNSLGVMAETAGRWAEAVDRFAGALAVARRLGDRRAEISARNALGIMSGRLGRLDDAERYLAEALDLQRDGDDRANVARLLNNLGIVQRMAGRYAAARASHEEALAISREAGSLVGEGNALLGLGTVDRHLDRDGTRYLTAALDIARRIKDPVMETDVLAGLAATALATGQAAAALDHYRLALEVADRLGHRQWQARIHEGLGTVHHALGDPDTGDAHWRRALSGYRELGAPEAEELANRLKR